MPCHLLQLVFHSFNFQIWKRRQSEIEHIKVRERPWLSRPGTIKIPNCLSRKKKKKEANIGYSSKQPSRSVLLFSLIRYCPRGKFDHLLILFLTFVLCGIDCYLFLVELMDSCQSQLVLLQLREIWNLLKVQNIRKTKRSDEVEKWLFPFKSLKKFK